MHNFENSIDIVPMTIKKFIAGLLALATLFGCSGGKNSTLVLHSEADLAGLRVGCSAGSYYEQHLSPREDIDLFIINTEADGMQALMQDKVDVFVTDEVMLTPESMRMYGVKKALRGEENFDVAFAVKKGNKELLDQLNAFIAQPIVPALVQNWTEGASNTLPPIPEVPQDATPLRCALCVNLEPISYAGEGGRWTGLDPELVRRFAASLGRPLEIHFQELSAAMIGLETGQVDIIACCLFVTEERKKSVDFSDPYYHCHPGFFVKDKSSTFRMSFSERLHMNLIKERRWELITDGLWKTLEITLFSILLGTLLGGFICAAKRSRRKLLQNLADLYCGFIEGIPTLVLLLLMFYVVFANLGVNATMVAIVTFSCTFAASAGSIFDTAISTVPLGQTEAGLSLGFTHFKTFTGIVLPQALQKGLPLYIGACVSMLKETSIVGYIAIQDLTRASDLVRSRTFDAFIPLGIVTISYFVIAWLIRSLLNLALRKKQHD